MSDEVKLSREERTQLEAANAEALEKEIAELASHYEGGRWDFKAFWLHSDRIHDIFRRIKPLRKNDRARLWEAFSQAREAVREKQEAERRYHQWLFEKRKGSVLGCMEELEELLDRPSKEDSDIEQILFLQDSLRLMAEPGWQGYPDTPEIALVSMRRGVKASEKENAETKRLSSKLRRKAARFLEKGAEEKFRELSRRMEELKDKKAGVSGQKLKGRIREIRTAIMCPILLREQKELLLKRAEELAGGKASLEETEGGRAEATVPAEERVEGGTRDKSVVPPVETDRDAAKQRDVDALLNEIEMSVARKKG